MTDPAFAVLDDLIAALERPGSIDPGLSRSVAVQAAVLRLPSPRTAHRPRPTSRFTGRRLVRPGSAARRAPARHRVVVPAGPAERRAARGRRLKRAR
ncbi:hypothetical protein [Rathayibacter sp. AY1B5]|jgi:hypothetical protein|uniref:hypothetical protein n=1 Tax=Rathayibacter sp. AY1B5 TaxID=2080530 RepID=UPI000CE8A348|nr:hypothetical protein [Rathayibacter sp. AY1B5]PPI24064.1 hypothetical protein C5D44_12205 [Rathayibacter sp. AY1B5]